MLVTLLNTPKTLKDWEIWSFANRDIQFQIRQAIQRQRNVNLQEYQLSPINFDRFQDYLYNNQQGHNDFNSELDLQSSDLSSVDIKDEKQLQNWIYLGYKELQNACQVLKI